ncbi:MAG TPA: ABC transporter ATP-binding protein [Bryobacteraceae bacterium]|nr:ABC transporter ATP-binding protein [Bryobacteraceae bacterium]
MSSPLRTERLTKNFRHVDALRDLSIEVPEGSVFALVGPNGAGKTTAMKTLLNIHEPTSGRAELLGVDSRSLAAREFARIGYVSENQKMPDWMTVGYFLSYCREFYPEWSDADAVELVRVLELPLDRKLRHLSRGMRVKAALASSLAYRPKLILLDEPFGGLDVLVREQLIESVLDRTPEATVFLSSHDLAEIESFASHIAYLSDGRLLFAEEMSALSARFRDIEVTLDEESELPADLPVAWLNLEHAGVVARFIDSQFDGERHRVDIQHFFPRARSVNARAMTLRAIILAVSKAAQPAKRELRRSEVTPCV